MTTQENDRTGARLLFADNFTPPSRTPWGGSRLRSLKSLGDGPSGEAWELSVEPDFPSRCEPDGALLSEVLRADPARWLGQERPSGSTALLVKLLDAAEALSVQIHPDADYSGLAPDESGKPEAWYVFDHDPGAGLYVGFAEGVSRRDVEQALSDGASLEPLLFFVPVERGDFFLIDAGTPHCVGAGIGLVEPQHVEPGKRGVTYRYWDWGRTYGGRPRELHLRQALEVTDWTSPRADALLVRRRLRAGPAVTWGPARAEPLCSPDGPARSPWLTVARLTGSGALRLEAAPSLRGLTVLEGSVRIGSLEVPRGRSAALAASDGFELGLTGAHAILSSVVPS